MATEPKNRPLPEYWHHNFDPGYFRLVKMDEEEGYAWFEKELMPDELANASMILDRTDRLIRYHIRAMIPFG